MSVKFSEIKDKLQQELQKKLNTAQFPGEGGFTLIEGFMALPLYGEVSNNVIIGGPTLPIVGIVGNTSGRLYTFALKAILPEVEI